MAGLIKRLAGPAYIANSATNIYNPSANTYGVIYHIHVVNTDTSARTFTLYIGATGGSAAGTEIFKDHSLAAKAEFDFYCELRIDVADFLSGIADAASKVVITVEGQLYPL
jgi:hypothetical protein